MIISAKAYPRAGLIGNPSDGYYGKTIAFVFRNFQAEVLLYETPELEILPNTRDHSRFADMRSLAEDVSLFGYYGGIRLLKASIKRFYNHCQQQNIKLEAKNFSIRYHSNIPAQVGLAGSSAIITAGLRALMRFYGVMIPKPVLANLILSVEKDELGISAGLQDRVAQVYEGLVFMDFDRAIMEQTGCGRYEYLPLDSLPPLYIAYRTDLSEGSEVFHNDIRGRFERGDRDVLEAMLFWADLTRQTRELLLRGQGRQIGDLLNASFDMRRKIYRISQGNIEMVETARAVGASAKFSGSGGAIVGAYADEAMFQRLTAALEARRIKVFKPEFIPAAEENKYDT